MVSIEKQNFKGLKAIIRVDFNVPLDTNNKVLDSSRIEAAKPTILKVINDGGSCILMSHLGRPKKKETAFSLKNLIPEIEKILKLKLKFAEDALGNTTKEITKNLRPGEVLLLENLRFYPEETQGEIKFAQKLASYGDCYINDAFGTAHRAHASTTTIAQFFKSKKYSGMLLYKEVESIKKVLQTGKRPVLAILGGAKVSSKIPIIENIIDKVDQIIIGGGMAFTFVKALGGKIGDSICEEDKETLALSILKKAKKKKIKVYLPVDVLCSDKFSNKGNKKVFEINKIPKKWQGLDSGPESIKIFSQVIMEAKTILWNGPIGVFELESFSKGTIAIGNSVAKSTQRGAFSLVGGGDSVAAVKKFNFQKKVSYVSTGGGAMLESLEGKVLPGIEALSN
ncbi:MAG: phosphoglycerate kinase [Flavobacteriaceae bacterium]|nr:phosphoglycerate kinase [Flavobacteriaceae bacterium]